MTESRVYHILGNWEGAGGGFFFNPETNSLAFNIYPSNSPDYVNAFATNNTSVSLDTWYTLVGTFNQGQVTLYINGEEAATTSSPYTTVHISLMPFFIGGNPNNQQLATHVLGQGTAASSDSVLIFNRALTAEEIANDYTGVITPSNKNDLLAYYTFDY